MGQEQIDTLAADLIRQIEEKSGKAVEHGLQQTNAPAFLVTMMRPVMLMSMKLGYLAGAQLALQKAIEVLNLDCPEELTDCFFTKEQFQLRNISDALQMEMMDIGIGTAKAPE